jgi:[ribosomal protein S5]-alanine N-acetyltransferase
MELQGTGFTLRGWHMDDIFSLQKHADNPNVYNFLMDAFPHPYTIDDAANWITRMQKQNPVLVFAIDVGGKLVGGIGLEMRHDIYSKSPLIGYWLGEEFWGHGIMTEAVRLVSAYAFAHLDIVRLQAGILGNNPASMRVLEKAGFVREGILRNAIVKNGVVLDEVVYGLVKG